MKHILIGLICLTMTGCMSQAEYEAYKAKREARQQQSGQLVSTSNGIAYFNKNPQYQSRAELERELNAKREADRLRVREEIAEASARVDAQLAKDRNLPPMEQPKKVELNCYQRAVITYRVMQQNAVVTGDYSQVVKYDVASLKKICEKNK
ncbi:hypothetical protein SJ_02 [Proteus phage SJ_PmiM]|nr:hypothetical protein SJ_02 [Proteus phage SJ_PmiM]